MSRREGKRVATTVLKGFAFAALAAALVFAARMVPVRTVLPAFLDWVHGFGVVGALLLGFVYAVGTVLFLPGSLLTLAAGFLYGPLWGTVVSSLASVTGATAAFLLGRTVAKKWIARKMASNEKFAALQEAIAREGLKILMLVRLSPVFPFNLVNYAFGLTRLTLREFVLGSWIAMLPGTILYVYLGSLLPDAASLAAGAPPGGPGGGLRRLFLWLGFGATLVVILFVTRVARRAVAKAAPSLQREPEKGQLHADQPTH